MTQAEYLAYVNQNTWHNGRAIIVFASLKFSLNLFAQMAAQNQVFSLSVYDYATQWREARAKGNTDAVLKPPDSQCMLSGHFNENIPSRKIKTGYICHIDLHGR